jgi:hypothetical protein
MTTYEALHPWGMAAQFATPEDLLSAVRKVVQQGYTKVETYSPFKVDGVAEELGFHPSPVALIFLVAGMIGAVSGFGMCWYAFVINYPLNIGGRPHNSWPAWIPITFELMVLFAAVIGAIGMLMLNGLPRMSHPVFDIPGFERASLDRFFLCIEARDPRYDGPALCQLLETLHPLSVTEVLQ